MKNRTTKNLQNNTVEVNTISKNNQTPNILIKFRWVIFMLLIVILFLVEDYSNFITSENKTILSVVNIFISYAFISGIKK